VIQSSILSSRYSGEPRTTNRTSRGLDKGTAYTDAHSSEYNINSVEHMWILYTQQPAIGPSPETKWIHSTLFHLMYLILSSRKSLGILFVFSDQNFLRVFMSTRMPYLVNSPWFHYVRNIRCRTQILDIRIMQLFAVSQFFFPLWSKYSYCLKHPVFKYPNSILPQMWQDSYPYKKGQFIVLYILILTYLDSRRSYRTFSAEP
jgi:hypothetical protein